MSFLTCFWLFPQKEHLSRSPPSPIRATGGHPPTQGVAAGPTSYELPRRYPVPPPVGGTDTNSGAGYAGKRSGQGGSALEGLEDGVDQAVLDRALGGEDLVALDVAADLVDRAAAVVADHLLQELAHAQDLVGLDL